MSDNKLTFEQFILILFYDEYITDYLNLFFFAASKQGANDSSIADFFDRNRSIEDWFEGPIYWIKTYKAPTIYDWENIKRLTVY